MVREDVRNVHASCSLMHLHFCIPPSLIIAYPLIKFLLTYDILSQELHTLIQMVAPRAPPRSDTFLDVFGTPTLLWMVLNSVVYAEPHCNFWMEVAAEGQPWYDVQVTILDRADNP